MALAGDVHTIAQIVAKRNQLKDKNAEMESHAHTGVRFSGPSYTSSIVPRVSSITSVLSPSHSQLGFLSSAPAHNTAAAMRGSQTERGTKTTAGRTLPTMQHASPNTTKALAHFPAAPQMMNHSASSSHVTHPKFVKLLEQLEAQQRSEEKRDSPSPAGGVAKMRRNVPAATQPVVAPSQAAKIDLANVEHFDKIQSQIQSMFETLLTEHNAALMRRFQQDMQKHSNRMEFSQVELEKQHQATLSAVSLAHSQRASKLLADFKSRYATLSNSTSHVEAERLRFFESAYPEVQQVAQKERESWERARGEWEKSYEKLSHKYKALLQHTNQISKAVREQSHISVQLENQLIQAGITPQVSLPDPTMEQQPPAETAGQEQQQEDDDAAEEKQNDLNNDTREDSSPSQRQQQQPLSQQSLESEAIDAAVVDPSTVPEVDSSTVAVPVDSVPSHSTSPRNAAAVSTTAARATSASGSFRPRSNHSRGGGGQGQFEKGSLVRTATASSSIVTSQPPTMMDAEGCQTPARWRLTLPLTLACMVPFIDEDELPIGKDLMQQQQQWQAHEEEEQDHAADGNGSEFQDHDPTTHRPGSSPSSTAQLLTTAAGSTSSSSAPGTPTLKTLARNASDSALAQSPSIGTAAPSVQRPVSGSGATTKSRSSAFRVKAMNLPSSAIDASDSHHSGRWNSSSRGGTNKNTTSTGLKVLHSRGVVAERKPSLQVHLDSHGLDGGEITQPEPVFSDGDGGEGGEYDAAVAADDVWDVSSDEDDDESIAHHGGVDGAGQEEGSISGSVTNSIIASTTSSSSAAKRKTKRKTDGALPSATSTASKLSGQKSSSKSSLTSPLASPRRRRVKISKRASVGDMPVAAAGDGDESGNTSNSHSVQSKSHRGSSTKKVKVHPPAAKEHSPAKQAAAAAREAQQQQLQLSRSMSMPFGVSIDPGLFQNKGNKRESTGAGGGSTTTTGGGGAPDYSSLGLDAGDGSLGPDDDYPEDDLLSFQSASVQHDGVEGMGGESGTHSPHQRRGQESLEQVSERWKGRLLKLRIQLSRAQGKNEALVTLLKSSNERNSTLTQALELSKKKQQKLGEEITAATKNGTDLLNQLRIQTSTRRKDLILKLQESESEMIVLREELMQLREQQIEFKKQGFTISTLRNDLSKQMKRCERFQATSEHWKSQMEESLKLVQQLQAELVASKEDQHASLRALKKRLVLKSIWFRTQLIKLERLQELCLGMDEYLRPELTCPSCLEIFKYPQSLSPCGHTMCAKCVNTIKHDRSTTGGAKGSSRNVVCHECKRECDSTAPNFILEGVLSRYHWWTMLLKDFYSNKTLTLQQEQNLKYMMVKRTDTKETEQHTAAAAQ